MHFSKVGIIFTLLGLGGAATSLFSVASLSGAILSKSVKKEFDLQAWLKDHTHRCYKWIYYDSTTDGEIQACEDRNSSNDVGSPKLKFYLWWLKSGSDFNKHYEVEKITGVDHSNSISFAFKGGNHGDKKLKIHHKAPRNLKESAEKLTNTTKTLTEICKISGSNLTCTDTEGSKSYSLRVQEVTSYF